MTIYNKNNKIKTLLISTMTSFLLVACDGQKQSKPVIKVPVQKYKQVKVLRGSVADKNGPVLDGEVSVADSAGRIVVTGQMLNNKEYKVEIPAGTTLPVVITVKPKRSSETLRAVIISPAVSKYDISPLTTKIAKRAKELGGYTYANMVLAADSTVGVPDANKTSTGFRGDPTAQYGGWH